MSENPEPTSPGTTSPGSTSTEQRQAIVGAALVDFEVDLENFTKFPVLDPSARYLKESLDIRQQTCSSSTRDPGFMPVSPTKKPGQA